MNSTINNKTTTEQILNLIDDIQNKLLKSQQERNYAYYSENLFGTEKLEEKKIQNENIINNINNQSAILNQSLSNEIEIKKLIKEEFDILISSYQTKIYNTINELDNKIDNNYLNIKNEQKNLKDSLKFMNINDYNKFNVDITNSLKDIKQLIINYVPYDEYQKNNKEIFEQIDLNKNNIGLQSKNFEDIKNKFDYIINQNNNKLENEIKLNEVSNKYTSVQKKLDEYYQELKNFKNNISSNYNKINEENKVNVELEKIKNIKLFGVNKNDEKILNEKIENMEQKIKYNEKSINILFDEFKKFSIHNKKNIGESKTDNVFNSFEDGNNLFDEKNENNIDINSINKTKNISNNIIPFNNNNSRESSDKPKDYEYIKDDIKEDNNINKNDNDIENNENIENNEIIGNNEIIENNENNGPRGELPIPVNDENAEIMESRNEFDDYDIIEE
jgi:hypothetical protein